MKQTKAEVVAKFCKWYNCSSTRRWRYVCKTTKEDVSD